MEKLILGIAVVIAFNTSANAQINLIGAAVNDSTGKIDLVQWEALDSLSVVTTPTILDGYYFATLLHLMHLTPNIISPEFRAIVRVYIRLIRELLKKI
jgi:hypothetical protein